MRETGDILGGGSDAAVIIETQPGQDVVLPDGAYLAAADFARLGGDLLLQAEGQPSVLVRGYFEAAQAPSLLSPGGAKLGPELVAKLAGPLAPGQSAQASAASGGEMIGKVTELTGTARVTRTNGVEEELAVGDPVYLGDVLATGADSSVGITFVDDTLFSLGAEARLVLNSLIFDPGGDANTLALSLVTGAFALISGQIAGSDGPGITVETPVATIGVRGTALSGFYDYIEQKLTATLLEFADEVGNFDIYNDVSLQSAISALHTFVVTSPTAAIGLPRIATAADLALYTKALASATKSFVLKLQEQNEPEAGDPEQSPDGSSGSGKRPDLVDPDADVQDFGEANEGTVEPSFDVPIELTTLIDLFGLDPNLLLLLGLSLPQGIEVIVTLAQGLESQDSAGDSDGAGTEGTEILLNILVGDRPPGVPTLSLEAVPPGVTVVSEFAGVFFVNETDEPQSVALNLAALSDLAVIPPEFSDTDFTVVFRIEIEDVLSITAIVVNVQAVADLAKLFHDALTAPVTSDPLQLIAALQEFAGLNEIQTEREGQGRIGLNESFDEADEGFVDAQDLGALDAAETGKALTVNGWAGRDADQDIEAGILPRPDVDVYKVTLTAGSYRFDIDFASLDETSEPDAAGRIDSFDASLAVYDAEGNRLGFDPGVPGEDPFLSLEIAEDGMYFVVVTPSLNLPVGESYQDGFDYLPALEDDLVGDYQLQIRGDEGPILPGEVLPLQSHVEDNATEVGEGMYADSADLTKRTDFLFQVGEQIEDGEGGTIVGPDGSESITRAQITVEVTNEGESFADIADGFMFDFGAGDGFVSPGAESVAINARVFGESDFEVVQAGLSIDPERGIFVLTFPESLRVQEVDLRQLDWKVARHDDHDFDLEVIVRTTETHPVEPIAFAIGVTGEPTVTRLTNEGPVEEPLLEGSTLLFLDTITTGPDDALFLVLTDGSTVEIGPDEELVLDTEILDPPLGADTAGFEGDPGQVAIPHNHLSARLPTETRAVADKPLVSLTKVCVIEDVMVPGDPDPLPVDFAVGTHLQQSGEEGAGTGASPRLLVTSELDAQTQDRDGTETIDEIELSVSDVALFSPDLALADFMLFIDGDMIRFDLLADGPQQITLNEVVTVFRDGGPVVAEAVTAEVALAGETLVITFPDNDEAGDESILGLTVDIDFKYPQHEAEDFTLHAKVTTKELNPFGEVEVLTQTDSTSERIEVKEVADKPLVVLTGFTGDEDQPPTVSSGPQPAAVGSLVASSMLTANAQDRDGSESISEILLSLSGVTLSDPGLALGDFRLRIGDDSIDFTEPFPQSITLEEVTLFRDGVEVSGPSVTVAAEVDLVGETLVITFPDLGTVEDPAVGTLAFADDAILDIKTTIALTYPEHEAEDFLLTAEVKTIELNPDGAVAVSEASQSKTAAIVVREVADLPVVTLTADPQNEDGFVPPPPVPSGPQPQPAAVGPLVATSVLTAKVADEDGSEGLTEVRLSASGVNLLDAGLALGDFRLSIDGKPVDAAALDDGFLSGLVKVTLYDATTGGVTDGEVRASVALNGAGTAEPELVLRFPDNEAAGQTSIIGLGHPGGGGEPGGWLIELTYPEHEAEDFKLHVEVDATEINPDEPGTLPALATATRDAMVEIVVREVADAPVVELTPVVVEEDEEDGEGEAPLVPLESESEPEAGTRLTAKTRLTAVVQDEDGSEGVTEVRLSVSGVDLSDPGLALDEFDFFIDGQKVDALALQQGALSGLSVSLYDAATGGVELDFVSATLSLVNDAELGPVLVLRFDGNDGDVPGERSIIGLGGPDAGGVPEGWELTLTYPEHEAENFTLQVDVQVTEVAPDEPGTTPLVETAEATATVDVDVQEIADLPMVELTGFTGNEDGFVPPPVPSGPQPQPAAVGPLVATSTLTAEVVDKDGSEGVTEVRLSALGVDLLDAGLALGDFRLSIDGKPVNAAALSDGFLDGLVKVTLYDATTGGVKVGEVAASVVLNGAGTASPELVLRFPDNDAAGETSIIGLGHPDSEGEPQGWLIELTYPTHEAEDFTLRADVEVTEVNPDGTRAVTSVEDYAEAAIVVREVADALLVGLDNFTGNEDGFVPPPVPSGPVVQPATTSGVMVTSELTAEVVDRDGSETLDKIVLSAAGVDSGLNLSGFSLSIGGNPISFTTGFPQPITLSGATLFRNGSEVTGETVSAQVDLVSDTLVITFPENDAFGDDSILNIAATLALTYPEHEAEDFSVTADVYVKELNPDPEGGPVEDETTMTSKTATIVVKEVADAPTVEIPGAEAPPSEFLLLEEEGEEGEEGEFEEPLPVLGYCEDNDGLVGRGAHVFGIPISAAVVDEDGSEGISRIKLTLSGLTVGESEVAGEFDSWTHDGGVISDGEYTRLIDGVTAKVTVDGLMLTIDYLDEFGLPIDEAPLAAAVSEIGVKLAEHYNGSFFVDYEVIAKEVNPDPVSGPVAVETAMTSGSFEIDVKPVNDAPELDDSDDPALTAIDEDTADPDGNTVAEIVVDGSITDVDVGSGAPEAIAVTFVDDSNGTWQFSTGGAFTDIGAVSDEMALLLGPTDKIRFLPDADFSGTASFAFRAWDRTEGVAGNKVDASDNGGTSAFSSDSETARITVQAVADAPEVVIPGAEVPVISFEGGATPFSENFNAGSLGPNLSTTYGDAPSFTAGVVSFGVADYVGTNDADYHTSSFIAEIKVIPTSDSQAFFGLGRGSTLPDPFSEPYENPAVGPVVYLRHFDPGGGTTNPNNLTIATNDEGNSGLTFDSETGFGEISNQSGVGPGNVPYTLMLAYDHINGTVQFFVDDVLYEFVHRDFSVRDSVDVSGYDFTGEGHIFFGGTNVAFDDFSVEVVEEAGEPAPTLLYCEDNIVEGESEEGSGSPVFGLPIDASVADRDGSEGISQIQLSLDGLSTGEAGELIAWTYEGVRLDEDQDIGRTVGDVSATLRASGTTLTIDFADGVAPQDVEIDEIGVELAEHYNGSFSVDYVVTAKELGSAPIAVETAMTSGGFDVYVKPVNDAPELDNNLTAYLTDVTVDQTSPSGNSVAQIVIDGTITDADIAPGDPVPESIAITSTYSSELGTWQFSTDGGGTFDPIGSVSETSALLLDSSAIVRFVPNGIGTGRAEFLYRAWDETDGVSGTKVDTSDAGGTSAFSTAIGTADVTILPGASGTPSSANVYTGPDPLFFDKDGDGFGFLQANEGVAFDLNADGVAERIAWGDGEDGLLAMDLDGSGRIEDGREVFSPDFAEGGFRDALEALVSLDDNGDGRLDAQDAAFEAIRLWFDGDGDGETDEGELTGLDEQGIVAIDLDTTAVDQEIDGQEVYARGDYVLESGEARQFIAVNLDEAAGDGAAEAPQVSSVLPAILRSGDDLAPQQAELPDLASLAALRRASQFVARGDFVTGAYALVPLAGGLEADWASAGLLGAIDGADDVDVFAFLARAGETLRVEALSAAPGTVIELRGADGTLLASDAGAGPADPGAVPGEAELAARSLSVAAPADGLTFVVLHAAGGGAAEAGGGVYHLAMSIALDGANDVEFGLLGPGQSSSYLFIDADQYLALGEPIPIELLLETSDADGSERLYELEISGLRAGGSLSYLDADGVLVTVSDGNAADGDGLLDGRIALDLTQYEGSALATGPGGRLISLATGEAGIDLRLNEDAIDDSDMALMIKAVSQEVGVSGAAEFAEELVTVDVVVSGVSGILADTTGENALQGGAGGDLLLGGLGADRLRGGAGADTFIYRPGDGGDSIAGADTILDFQNGVDLIGLADGLSFAGLSIADSALGAVISADSETLAIVTGTPAVDLNADDFVAMPF